jgi:hypothetical protein
MKSRIICCLKSFFCHSSYIKIELVGLTIDEARRKYPGIDICAYKKGKITGYILED